MALPVNINKAYTYFQNRYVMRKSSQDFYAFDCPFCDIGRNKMNCAVKFDWKIVKCWSCGYKERIETFIMDVEGVTSNEAWRIVEAEKVSPINLLNVEHIANTKKQLQPMAMPYGYTSIMEGDTVIGKRARAYLEGRGLDLQVLDRLGVGYGQHKPTKEGEANYFGYIIIPFKFRGVLQYYLGRNFLSDVMRYKNPDKEVFNVGKADLLFNEDALELRSVVFITEGCFDALTLGSSGVATMGWSLSETQKGKLLRSNCKMLVFVPDVGYYPQAIKTSMSFVGHKKVKVLPMDTLAEYGKDVNSIGWEKVIDLYKETPVLTFAAAVEAVNKY